MDKMIALMDQMNLSNAVSIHFPLYSLSFLFIALHSLHNKVQEKEFASLHVSLSHPFSILGSMVYSVEKQVELRVS